MKYTDLLSLAQERIDESPDAERDSMEDRLVLTMPEPERHNGYRVRLFGNRGPYAVILNGRGNRLTVYVSARRIRDYLDGYVIHSETA